jgi:hypothetical protein
VLLLPLGILLVRRLISRVAVGVIVLLWLLLVGLLLRWWLRRRRG